MEIHKDLNYYLNIFWIAVYFILQINYSRGCQAKPKIDIGSSRRHFEDNHDDGEIVDPEVPMENVAMATKMDIQEIRKYQWTTPLTISKVPWNWCPKVSDQEFLQFDHSGSPFDKYATRFFDAMVAFGDVAVTIFVALHLLLQDQRKNGRCWDILEKVPWNWCPKPQTKKT